MKKIIKHLSLLLMFLACCAQPAMAQGILSYKYDANTKTAGVYGLADDNNNIVIPATIEHNGVNYSVTTIGERAFLGCRSLKSIEIPNSVTKIGEDAFWYCDSLASVTIGTSVSSIGRTAFFYCKALKSIEIPNSVISIGKYAFQNCQSLTSLTIGDSVTTIGKGAFFGCTNLERISVSKENKVYDSRDSCNAIIETAVDSIIKGCKNSVIPNSVTKIGSKAFAYCYSLASIEIPSSVTTIGSWAFEYCTGLRNIEIPNSVTSIGKSAFLGCAGLTSVTLGNSITMWNGYAFSECDSLKSVTSLSATPPSIKSSSFSSTAYGQATLYVPTGSAKWYNKNNNSWSRFSNIVEKDLTAIKPVIYEKNEKTTGIYDIEGRKLSAPQKGINIINGRKVLVR